MNAVNPVPTSINVTVTTSPQPLPVGVVFNSITIAVVDNSGASLADVSVNGSETPPFTANFTGAQGSQEATATLQAIDTSGNPIGAPVVLTESGTGGQPQTFPAPIGGTITVS